MNVNNRTDRERNFHEPGNGEDEESPMIEYERLIKKGVIIFLYNINYYD